MEKYAEDNSTIDYSIELDGSVGGFTPSKSVSGNTTNFIMRKDAAEEPQSSGSSSPSQGSSGGPSSSAPKPSGKSSSGSSGFPGAGSKGSQTAPSGSAPGTGGAAGAGATGSSKPLTDEGDTIEDAKSEDDPYTFAETTLCSLAPNDMVSVDVSIDELDIGQIVVGSDVQVTLDALPGQHFDGKISALDPFGQNSGGNTKYTVTISMGKQENMLLGMNASVSIELEERNGVLVIPEAALVEQDGKTYVHTSYDEAADELGGLVEVETGIADGTKVEIVSGLEEGQGFYYRYAGTISYTFTNR